MVWPPGTSRWRGRRRTGHGHLDGGKAAGLLISQTNQAGVGQNTYGPDFSAMGSTHNWNGQGDPNGLALQ